MGSVLITSKTRKRVDVAALSCLWQSVRELCLLQLLHPTTARWGQGHRSPLKAAAAVRKVPIPTHYHFQEKNT